MKTLPLLLIILILITILTGCAPKPQTPEGTTPLDQSMEHVATITEEFDGTEENLLDEDLNSLDQDLAYL